MIKVGDTVELHDTSKLDQDLNHSGDFLRIKHIIIDVQTGQVRLRGHRLRRAKYLQQLFEWKLNELAMVLHAEEDDTRCPMVAGMEDISVDMVLRTRDCVLTNKPYPLCSFRDDGYCAFPVSLGHKEIKHQIFHGGRLVCRMLNVLNFKDRNAKARSGIVRQLYAKEADAAAQ
jgi:DNA (cytosine-5)-methyltransferase 1